MIDGRRMIDVPLCQIPKAVAAAANWAAIKTNFYDLLWFLQLAFLRGRCYLGDIFGQRSSLLLFAAHCYAVLVRILLCFEINLLLLIVLCACSARRKGVITHVINATQFASALSHGPRCRIVPHTQTINRKREREQERTQRRRSRMGRRRGGVAILCLSHNSLAQRLEWPRALVKAGERERKEFYNRLKTRQKIRP